MTQIVSPFVVAVKALFMSEVNAAQLCRKDTQATIETVARTFSRSMKDLNGTPVSRSELFCGLGIACGQVLVSYDLMAERPRDDADLEKIVLALAGGIVAEYRAGMAAAGADDLLGKAFKEASRGKP